MTQHATSRDGTRIGFETVGEGPPVLLVHGIGADRSQWAPVAAPLAQRFAVHLMDRRGRGLSAEEAADDYGVDKDGEDIAAVVEAIGSRPFVFGHGYGGLCVLKAAADGVEFERMFIDESPTGRPGPPMLPDELTAVLENVFADRGPEAALELFLQKVVGLTDDQVAANRASPVWPIRVATTHTVVRELKASSRYERESDRLGEVRVPVRFVVGRESPPQMLKAAELAHADMPGSALDIVEGRLFTSMYADAEPVAREIGDWFLSPVPAA